MPAIDVCHSQVVHALQKDGWTVDPQPFTIRVQRRRGFIDIIANQSINGTSQQILLAEVKCFQDQASWTNDLYAAIGQYIVYRTMLEQINISESRKFYALTLNPSPCERSSPG